MIKMDDPKISIIDYGMGNLFSVRRACEHVGLPTLITDDKSIIMDSDAVILPGVGAFGDAMANLARLDLITPLRDFIASRKPFMGICLGLQLLMTESEEFGNHKGLDIIKGSVIRFRTKGKDDNKIKVPQVGWNQIRLTFTRNDNNPLNRIKQGEYMYFVHSYYVNPDEKANVASLTDYEGKEYCSSIIRDNIFACQFHPEKSALEGLKIYSNWAEIVRKSKGAK